MMKATYLTDSINFRMYTGAFDEEGGTIYFRCIGDSVIVERREKVNTKERLDTIGNGADARTRPVVTYDFDSTRKIYCIKDLIKQHKFD